MTINQYTWVEFRNWTEMEHGSFQSVFTPNNNIPPKVSLLYCLSQTRAGNNEYLLKEGEQ